MTRYESAKAIFAEKGVDTDALDALSLAVEAGSAKAVNVVLMARFARTSSVPFERWIKAIEEIVSPAFRDVNVKAFEAGYNAYIF